MQKSVFEIELMDGRVFRIFCDNKKQEEKLNKQVRLLHPKVKYFIPIANGIHTQKQFEEILKNL